MVVCKCRKATKLYCFVHKVPVCGECICFPEHQICVVRTYSEWVIDGDYDWPPKCCHCQAVLEEGTDSQATRLGCLHVIHTNCLVSHIKSFPQHTAPAGYICPACSTSIWPPKSVKDSGSRLHSKLKEAILQTGMEKSLFGNHPVLLHGGESRSPPHAFDTEPLKHVSAAGGYDGASGARPAHLDIVEIDGPGPTASEPNFMKSTSPSGPGATTRKSTTQAERLGPEVPCYADDDDEDGNRKKYSRRGLSSGSYHLSSIMAAFGWTYFVFLADRSCSGPCDLRKESSLVLISCIQRPLGMNQDPNSDYQWAEINPH